MILKQSTAGQEVPMGPFLDSGDGNTEETGLTIANTDVKIWKEGATSMVNKNSGGGTHMSNGVYYVVLDATDTDTVGNLVIFIHVAGALVAKEKCVVLPANQYDMMLSHVEGTIDVVELLRIVLAAASGLSAGGGTSSLTFRDVADSKNRISATVDANGNRTAITRDGT